MRASGFWLNVARVIAATIKTRRANATQGSGDCGIHPTLRLLRHDTPPSLRFREGNVKTMLRFGKIVSAFGHSGGCGRDEGNQREALWTAAAKLPLSHHELQGGSVAAAVQGAIGAGRSVAPTFRSAFRSGGFTLPWRGKLAATEASFSGGVPTAGRRSERVAIGQCTSDRGLLSCAIPP